MTPSVEVALSGKRLIYVMGPSGAGKDSLLEWLRLHLSPMAPVHFARRTIDRPVQPNGEQHESVDTDGFARLRRDDAFAMHWQANGRHYGIRHQEFEPLKQKQWLLVNGSRAHLGQALRQATDLTVLHITASADILRARLLARGRETPEMVETRVQRAVTVDIPVACLALEVRNDSSLNTAGATLMTALRGLPGWGYNPTAQRLEAPSKTPTIPTR